MQCVERKPKGRHSLTSGYYEKGRPYQLTDRQIEVMQALVDNDLNQKLVAEKLFISLTTVKTHAHVVLQKTGKHKISAAVVLGLREGFLK